MLRFTTALLGGAAVVFVGQHTYRLSQDPFNANTDLPPGYAFNVTSNSSASSHGVVSDPITEVPYPTRAPGGTRSTQKSN